MEKVDILFEVVEAEVLTLIVGREARDFGTDLAGGQPGLSDGGRWKGGQVDGSAGAEKQASDGRGGTEGGSV